MDIKIHLFYIRHNHTDFIGNQMHLESNSIHHGDCLEALPSLPDKSVDFIITDLPYGTIAPEWDEVIPMNKLWEQYHRIIKPTGTIALFASQPFTTMLIQSNLDDFRYCWYWIKNQATNFFHAKSMPMRKVEEIVIFKKGKYKPQITDGHVPTNPAKGCSNGNAYHGKNKRDYKGGSTTRLPTNVLEFKCVNNYSRIHTSEKPVDLYEYLIKTYTDDGDLVLDHCAGSGVAAIACLNMHRKYILIEKDDNYFQLAKNRVENHQKNLHSRLF